MKSTHHLTSTHALDYVVIDRLSRLAETDVLPHRYVSPKRAHGGMTVTKKRRPVICQLDSGNIIPARTLHSIPETPPLPTDDCSCGCGRQANPFHLDHLSKYCGDLAWRNLNDLYSHAAKGVPFKS